MENSLIDTFNKLYDNMVASKDPRKMSIFGGTMKCMMQDIINWKPEIAQEYLDKLEAINWCNYVSKKEATTIVNNMTPKGGWSIMEWESYMNSYNFRMEERPYYNEWALYTTMNMIYSDSSESLMKLLNITGTFNTEDLFKAIYTLALDKLKDIDGMFNLRYYFHL